MKKYLNIRSYLILKEKVDQYILLTHDNRSNFLAKAALDRINHLS